MTQTVTQAMTQMVNKEIKQTSGMMAIIMLAVTMLVLAGSNAAAQGSGNGPTINGSVYGGGNLADVGGSVTVNIKAGSVGEDVYGGGALANTNTNIANDATIKTTVNLLGGTISGDAYGGGLGRIGVTAVTGVHFTQEEISAAQEGDPAYGKTTDDWKVTPVTGVEPVEAKVNGDIYVYLGGTASGATPSATAFNINRYGNDNPDTDLDETTLVKSGRIFGCNNLNGSPQGNVTVTVYKTVTGNEDKTDPELLTKTEGDHHYQVAAVYGGGNLANYTTAGKKAHVIINGCGDASIRTVYGGGNAAAVPETDVDINGSYEIGAVFGGGNGKDPYTLDNGTTWTLNSGANVNGNANTILYGGLIHEAFGGSNERGRILGNVSINTNPQEGEGTCDLDVGTIYGAGKNADIDGDLIVTLGCMPADKKTEAVYGGAENANVKGNVELTITSGNFGQVFGGNNQSGAIFGSITLNIMESGCSPINIDELYLGGNQAAYSVYGYYHAKYYADNGKLYLDEGKTIELCQDGGKIYLDSSKKTRLYQKTEGTLLYLDEQLTKPLYRPRTSASDNAAVYFSIPTADDDHTKPNTATGQYADPVLNIVSATSIGKVFGGGLGSGATLYGNPTVNINQAYPLEWDGYNSTTGTTYKKKNENFGEIGGGYSEGTNHVDGGIFGGGNQAKVYGNTTVNIGTETAVDWKVLVLDSNRKPILDDNGKFITQTITDDALKTVQGAKIAGNVYGGGNLADVTGNTFVNICAVETGTTTKTWTSVPFTEEKVTIGGNVYGGGKGFADTFTCEKAMVGTNNAGYDDNAKAIITSYKDGNTYVRIGNGKVGTFDNEQKLVAGTGNVYGGGEVGRVEMNTTVTIGFGDGTESSASAPVIGGDVFGAGSGKATHGYSALVRGNSTVTVEGQAWVKGTVYGGGEMASVGRFWVAQSESDANTYNVEIGEPYDLKSGGTCTVTIQGKAKIGPSTLAMPTFTGHVFGASKGILPYAGVTDSNGPGRMYRISNTDSGWNSEWEGSYKDLWEYYTAAYYTENNKGDEYEADYFKYIKTLAIANDTKVTINGNAFVKGSVYGGSENGRVRTMTEVNIKNGQIGCGNNQDAPYTDWTVESLEECPSWPYGIVENGKTEYYPYDPHADENGNYPDGSEISSSEGGRPASKASNGHTYYGNVFGGGSGKDPYKPGKWLMSAGTVGGTTTVNIEGGHILSSVYGGNETTDVAGGCTINMSGGTIGVPRTKQQKQEHAVVGNLFGAGKGDKRVLFNTWTNVASTSVNITGGTVYGSVFGGGEDGHVLGNATTLIEQANGKTITIGTTGLSGADGNVFGGGRGSETALTAGVVGGNVSLTVNSGTIKGSVYGGGRLASVGTNFTSPYQTDTNGNVVKDNDGNPVRHPDYGKLQELPTPADHGNIIVNVNGGTIGVNTVSEFSTGDIFGGSKGVTSNFELGIVRSTTINMEGNAIALGSVYGGGELAQVVGSHTSTANTGKTVGTEINISGGTIGIIGKGGETFGNVYGGGKGNTTQAEAGLIKTNTEVNISQAEGKTNTIYHNIYGGGAYGSVGDFTFTTGVPSACVANTGYTYVTITGGTIGTTGQENGMVFGSSRGDVAKPVAPSTGADPVDPNDKLAWVYDANVVIGKSGETGPTIKGSVYGSGENGHTYHDADIKIHSGTIGINSSESVTINDLLNPTKIVYEGKAYNYPYRGNVYGGGCGTDMYDSNSDGTKDTYNALAGIVRGNATVTVDGGQVVHNVYGAGAMGSVGTQDDTGAFTSSSGTTTIAISGGTIGVEGSDGGNVFGAARGDEKSSQSGVALVKTTNVTISGGIVNGSVYGGGALGDVGTYTTSADGTNTYLGGSGDCVVAVTGGTIQRHVFGAGKGVAKTFTCQKAMVKTASVTVSGGTVNGNVYGGGEVGRVENNTIVMIGLENNAVDGTKYYTKTTEGGTDTYSEATVTAGQSVVGYYVRSGENEPYTYTLIEASTPIVNGNVFGAGAGVETHGYSALVRGNSTVTIAGSAHVGKNVYGGGEIATVGKYWVTGQNYSGVSNVPDPPTGWPDGMPYATRDGGLCTVTIQGQAQIGPDAAASVSNEKGHVFGAGKGVNPHYDNTNTEEAKRSRRMNNQDKWEYFTGTTGEADYLRFLQTLALVSNTSVTIDGATVMGNVYGGSESGFVQDHTTVTVNNGEIGTTGTTTYGHVYGGGRGLATFDEAGRVGGNVTLAINDGTAYGSVYGGGEQGIVKGTVDVDIIGGEVKHDVYGGGALANTNTGNWDANGEGYSIVSGLTVGESVVTGLYTKSNETYTQITTANQTAAQNTDYYQKTGVWVTANYHNATDTSPAYTTYNTNVTLKGGTIDGNVYGGGLGRKAKAATATESAETAVEAKVYGDVSVKLNETTATDNCVVKGSVFGCNNENGSPQSAVTVHIFKTEGYDGHRRTGYAAESTTAAAAALADPEDSHHQYELLAVYGGGNQAAFKPDFKATCDTVQPRVIIDGCDLTSIQTVYGGGNAASVPATNVMINGTYEIQEVFGGGNGYGTMPDGSANPGANVGYKTYPASYDPPASSVTERTTKFGYGSGKANVNIVGGRIHRVFGGSNTKGNVRESAITILQDMEGCTFQIDEAYGGGKNAPMDADAKLLMSCIPGLKVAYGGARAADIQGDVTLNITNGTFDRVFGGNNESGTIRGSITINVEETGCRPLIIGELYGGGNLAAYSVYGYKNVNDEGQTVTDDNGKTKWFPRLSATDGTAVENTPYNDPVVNVKSFTSIGKIYGGGYGASAKMVGNPKVNINVAYGDWYNRTESRIVNDSTTSGGYSIPSHAVGNIGAIQNVYGGGNAAPVIGNTNVNVGTEDYVEIKTITAGTNVSNYYIRTNSTKPYTYEKAMGTAVEGTTYYYLVKGADIRNNVYGAGYGTTAVVTGDTNVQIGKKVE